MSMQRPILAAALVVFGPALAISAAARENVPAVQFAMMDMMPMGGGGGMPGQTQMPMGGTPQQGSGGMTNDNMMRMGGGMPAQGQAQMPMGGTPMAGCMDMMQNMMRMGSAQGGMPSMQGGPGLGPAMGAGSMPTMGSSAARLEGRIAFLRTELRITDAQTPAWDTFANTLRAGREHLDAARAALQEGATSADPMARLESHERHLRERVEAMHMTRMAFNTLYAQLDDAQKRMATTTMLPFIGAF